MEALDYWRLCDEISVIDAALLIVGEDPSSIRQYVENWEPKSRPEGYDAAKTALENAILGGRLRATIRREAHDRGYDEEPGPNQGIRKEGLHTIIFQHEPDWRMTTIRIEDLRVWLSSRGFQQGFFFVATTSGPAYLNCKHSNYAPKLAAAVGAWLAVIDDETLLKGKTPKQALEIWLRKNADKFGLTKDDGNPNEQGIEEISKIANWNPKGGAPKTPAG